ncbi:ATP-binding protein [Comamonas sp. NLF-1-9]|uniref:ATP-binding protein n=1 Tax=Comamonas sp. NLF-1-9 TaxID=2853163 RepID=UPI001C45CBF8|nr:ATP-binding protein [Comamonas sp. NLF-1-9]QXL84902.1 ATP-binding protein [Comamonas sp. NLF-1-9]
MTAERQHYHRFSAQLVKSALADTPVILIDGPRQCGKTTLLRQFVDEHVSWLSLDEETTLNAALNDPVGLLRGRGRVAIDEVQRAPALLRTIKQLVDEDRQPGRFLLTGSTDILTLPTLSDSLAGRMEVINLLPLAQSEMRRAPSSFLLKVLAGEPPAQALAPDTAATLMQAVLKGGYPEMTHRTEPARRQAWAREYVRAIVQRDIRDIATLDKLDRLPRLLRALAQQSGQLTNFSQMAGQLGIDDKTARKYVGMFEQVFLVRRLEPWFRNQLKRQIKTPKLHFLDSGLLATMRGLSADRLQRDRTAWGALLETFVHGELLKMLAWQATPCSLFHYRDKDQAEVDFVIEAEAGDIVGIEVKAAASVQPADFTGLRKLATAAGTDFRIGMVLYDGHQVLSFGGNLHAVPLSSLWTG